MRVIFMGTPDFAVPTLEELYKNGHDIVLVVTQPDKKRDRGKKISFSQVKEKALELGLEVYQPQSINKQESFNKLEKLTPDIIVVAAFGQLISEQVLNLPKYGCVNVHASLLPAYRGAAPINWAVINGENVSGVTTMMMAKGLDSGDILLKKQTDIKADESAGQLYDRLKILGAELLIETLQKIENNTIVRTPQNHNLATYAPLMEKSLGHIDWNNTCKAIKDLVRGTQPWPGCYTQYKDKKIKIFSVDYKVSNFEGNIGEIIDVDLEGIKVKCVDGIVIINQLQLPGKRKMNIKDFLAGNSIDKGVILE